MRPTAANTIASVAVLLFAGCDSGGPEATTPPGLEITTPSTGAEAADRATQRKLEAAYRAMKDAAAQTPPITTGRQLARFLQRKAPEAEVGSFAFVEGQEEASALIAGIGDPFYRSTETTVIVPAAVEGVEGRGQ